jgi:hypothetical protein
MLKPFDFEDSEEDAFAFGRPDENENKEETLVWT